MFLQSCLEWIMKIHITVDYANGLIQPLLCFIIKRSEAACILPHPPVPVHQHILEKAHVRWKRYDPYLL